MKIKADHGFTFIETIVAISIILILSAIIGFTAIRYIDRSRVAACRNQIEIFKISLQSYYLDCGQYPTQAQGLQALWEKPIMAPIPQNWYGPYVDRRIPNDPWNNNYIYRNPGDYNLPFTIISYGSDGITGGEGINADINSWD